MATKSSCWSKFSFVFVTHFSPLTNNSSHLDLPGVRTGIELIPEMLPLCKTKLIRGSG